MITAQEARALSDENRENVEAEVKKILNYISLEIKDAAKKGERSVLNPLKHSRVILTLARIESIDKKLIGVGFSVTWRFDKEDWRELSSISW